MSGLSIYELHSLAAKKRGCTVSLSGGRQFDHMGNDMGGCHECVGCDFGHGRGSDTAGLIDDFEVVMKDREVLLRWSCPSCSHPVYEDTTPIAAIDDAKAISTDPLCYTCRSKSK